MATQWQSAAGIAQKTIDQWEHYDKYRDTDGEEALYDNGKEPNDVAVAKALKQTLSALKRALDWIDRDEQTHGREFGVGNEVRDAIEMATGIRPESIASAFTQDYDRGDGIFVNAEL